MKVNRDLNKIIRTRGISVRNQYASFWWFSLSVGAAILCLLLSPVIASADEIPEAKAVACILGEARGEGEQGIRLMASALRNRGKTQGVYGCKADISREMAYLKAKGIYAQAVKAWRDSAKTDLVKGATYWGSTHVDGAWISKMKKHGYVLTAKHNGHEFYREVKK